MKNEEKQSIKDCLRNIKEKTRIGSRLSSARKEVFPDSEAEALIHIGAQSVSLEGPFCGRKPQGWRQSP